MQASVHEVLVLHVFPPPACTALTAGCFSPSCSWPATPHGPLLPSLSPLTLLTPCKSTCLQPAACQAMQWSGSAQGWQVGRTKAVGPRPASAAQTQQFGWVNTLLSPLLSPASPMAGVQTSWSVQETGGGTAWLSTNGQMLENRLCKCLIPPGVLERSKWEWVEETYLFKMTTSNQVTGLCHSPGRYRQDIGKGQILAAEQWGNIAHLMGRHPSACKHCHP